MATTSGVNPDAPQPSSSQNHTRFRVETRGLDDVAFVDPHGMDAFGSEDPEPAPATSAAAMHAAAAPAAAPWSARMRARAFGALALVEALVIAGLLTGGDSDLLDSRDGRLVIESDPAGADVWLDGRHSGATPLSLTSGAGERSLRIDAHGTSRTMTVDVARGQVTRVDFVMVSAAASAAAPAPSAAPRPRGRPAIGADPWADAWLDGRLGETPLVEAAGPRAEAAASR